jgi:hypothetical protein
VGKGREWQLSERVLKALGSILSTENQTKPKPKPKPKPKLQTKHSEMIE